MRIHFTSFSRRLAIWPTLPLGVHLRRDADKRPFPLNQEGCRIYSLARHAIWNACRAFGLGAGDVILVPAYHHGSEVEALLQAGVQVRYYEVNDALEPDPEELKEQMDHKVRALYIIHYLGFPQNAAYWREWCDVQGILLIEDAAQAFLATVNGQPVGSFGHVAVFCLYKTYGIPDGGALFSIAPPEPPSSVPKSGYWRMLKRHINWVAARRGEVGFVHMLIKPVFAWWKRINEHAHAEFDLGSPVLPLSKMSSYLIPKIVDEKSAVQRRENYKFLLKHLGNMVPSQFATLPEGACPFAFPVQVQDAKTFLEKLKRKGVMGLLFWLNPHPTLPVEQFLRSKSLRERVLALPVHQELTRSDLERIVKVVKACSAISEVASEPVVSVNYS
ncbi:aminotransferase class V-fold PLP-dependent enzyme [Pontibacter korlensis]|uniref:Aminotransferase DegT n=1 Tax=Pontibacter korlensis TaxID=400092 RepID=A0A0E3ZFJ8_9BACT|nr:aminotransferase class V-fold PLP-dependent enzyme [Pontibacter korlensis]AKD04393.1 hypothetical protein PKOR_16505 [Pontibacter korlensis]